MDLASAVASTPRMGVSQRAHPTTRHSTTPPVADHNAGVMISTTHRLALLLLIAIATAFTGCAAPSGLKHDANTIREHVIAVDDHGRPHDPASPNSPEYSMKQYRGQISSMLLAMDALLPRSSRSQNPDLRPRRVNAPADSLQNADDEMDSVLAAGYYPIYLDWNSDLLSSYGEHVTSITQGQTDLSIGRALLTPIYVIADLGRAAARTPIVWVNQAAGDLDLGGRRFRNASRAIHLPDNHAGG